MMSPIRVACLASACLVASATWAAADQARLADQELDRVTAGSLLFELNPAFDGVQNQVDFGLLRDPPPPPPPPAEPGPGGGGGGLGGLGGLIGALLGLLNPS